jgi:hypothetical protein
VVFDIKMTAAVGFLVRNSTNLVTLLATMNASVTDIDLSAPLALLLRDDDRRLVQLQQTYRALSDDLQSRVDHWIYVLAGSPNVSDAQWGRHRALERSACGALRLCVALQVLGLDESAQKSASTLRFWSAFEDRCCRTSESRSRIVDVERMWMREPTEQVHYTTIGYINGICHPLSTALDHDVPLSARWLSVSGADLARVHLVYNGDKGVAHVVEVAIGHQGIATLPTLLLLHEWFVFFERQLPSRYLQVAYSGGATHTALALHALPHELQRRVAVLAIAPSYFLEPELPTVVANVGKRNDIVPSLAKFSDVRWPVDTRATPTNTVVAVEHETQSAPPHDPHVDEMRRVCRAHVERFHQSAGHDLH